MACFDILGTIDAGFQLRLRDLRPTPSEAGSSGGGAVLLDINLCYRDGQGSITSSVDSSPSDASLEASLAAAGKGKHSSCVWTATHYEQAAARRHGIYRYRWPAVDFDGIVDAPPASPDAVLPEAQLPAAVLQRSDGDDDDKESGRPSTSGASTSGGWALFYGHPFLIPGTAYLRTYFGSDWRTPKVYGYEEALRTGQYRNLVPE